MTQDTQDNDKKSQPSLLSEIIEESRSDRSTAVTEENTETVTPISGDTPKKTKDPIRPAVMIKAILALFFTSVIFLAIGLAYIIFNPDEAQIFMRMFDIDIPRLKIWLSMLVNSSFGILSLGLSIALFIGIFRAIWTPREQKRKKTIAIIISILLSIFLLTVFSLWMFLVTKIGTTIWDGGVIGIYDNTLYSNEQGREFSALSSTQDIIGPISIRYDISGNARVLSDNGNILINSYNIDFDGAICGNGRSIIEGGNPENEENIICTFDEIRTYNIRGTYAGTDIQGNSKNINIDIKPVEIGGLITITQQQNSQGKELAILDATALKLIGEPIWTYENGKKVNNTSIFHELTDIPVFVSLKVGDMNTRVFMIEKGRGTMGSPTIEAVPSLSDPKNIALSITGLTIDYNSILKVEWIKSNGTVLCASGDIVCNHTFSEYGRIKIKAIIHTVQEKNITIDHEIVIAKPLRILRHARVKNKDGKILNTDGVFDPMIGAYVIKDIIPPEKIDFDARNIVVENPGYQITEVRWKLSDGKNIIEKIGEQVEFAITNSLRYTVTGIYTFEKRIAGAPPEIATVLDEFIIDVEYRNLVPQLDIIEQTSDYVPSSITVDGSQSWSEQNDIIKFIYNFGEGKSDSVGDAVQTYEYTTPGEKIITLTIIDNTGERAEIKKTVVLKESPRTLSFIPSISPGIVGLPIDFTVKAGGGYVESYVWSFGDNTPTQRGEAVTHIFATPGTYTINLIARYADGTQKEFNNTYMVEPRE